jgi:hypothetical protein
MTGLIIAKVRDVCTSHGTRDGALQAGSDYPQFLPDFTETIQGKL